MLGKSFKSWIFLLRKKMSIDNNVTLVLEKLEQWEWFMRFIATNPDLEDRWEQHKTYEILKNDHGNR